MQRMNPNKTTSFLHSLFLLLVLLSAHEAMAQPQNGSELSVSASVLHFGYQETEDDGSLLNREDGNIPGLVLGVSHTSNSWVFAGEASYHGGEVVYDGQTNAVPPVPVKTRTLQSIGDMALRSEYWMHPRYALYLGAGYHYWGRDIQPGADANGNAVGGLFEAYSWWSGFLGAKASLYESGTSHWLVDARLLQIINPTMSVRFSGYDSATLKLGERPGLRIAAPWRYTIGKSSNLNINPFAEIYELGRSANTTLTSNGSPTGQQIYEPRSLTRNYGLNIGISQHF